MKSMIFGLVGRECIGNVMADKSISSQCCPKGTVEGLEYSILGRILDSTGEFVDGTERHVRSFLLFCFIQMLFLKFV